MDGSLQELMCGNPLTFQSTGVTLKRVKVTKIHACLVKIQTLVWKKLRKCAKMADLYSI